MPGVPDATAWYTWGAMPADPAHPPSADSSGPRGGGEPRIDLPSVIRERERQSQRVLLLAVRLLFMVMLVIVTLLPFVGQVTDQEDIPARLWLPVLIGAFMFGALVLIVDAFVPNKRLAPVFGVYLGIVAGLVGALAIGALIDLVADSWDLRTPAWIPYLNMSKLAIGVTLCYLAVSIVLTTRDDFRLVIPYVEFAKQVRGVRPMLIDTSVLIDGRIEQLGQTGFLDAPLIVPQFVIDELQTLADSGDRLKRARGRRGLGVVSELQVNPYVDISIDSGESGGHSVDHMLLGLARDQNLRILTTDYNLNKVAKIHGVTVLNINDLAGTLRSQVVPGELLLVEIIKPGESERQGVGYMPDGTMVVVEEAADRVGERVNLVVTNSLQTSAGRMIFGRVHDEDDGTPGARDDDQTIEAMGESATHQPRATERPPTRQRAESRRNPRR